MINIGGRLLPVFRQ